MTDLNSACICVHVTRVSNVQVDERLLPHMIIGSASADKRGVCFVVALEVLSCDWELIGYVAISSSCSIPLPRNLGTTRFQRKGRKK